MEHHQSLPETNGAEQESLAARNRIVRELPIEMRPREELERRGVANVADEVLLAVLLRSGISGQNVIEVARELLAKANGLQGLHAKSSAELNSMGIRGIGKVKAMELAAAFELGRRAAGYGPKLDRVKLRDPESVWRLLEPEARLTKQESFWVLLLDSKHNLLGQPHRITVGLLDATAVHPREVFALAFTHRAAAIIVAHNHPSGDPTPSAEDLRITRQLVEVARIHDLRLLDHVIIGQEQEGRSGYVSLRDQGLVSF